MTRVKSWLALNPIIVKELRSRMRGGRAFITLTAALLVTGAALYGLLQVMIAMADYQMNIVSPLIGQVLFSALVFIEMVVICAITPAVTAGAISGEREKQTYEMLQATPLSPASILWGKLVSAMSYVFLILFAGIPLASIVFIFGGVTLRSMFKALALLLVVAVAFGVLGLFMSALFKRTGRATVASFLVVLALLFVPIFAAFAVSLTMQGQPPPRWIMSPSPISMLSSAFDRSSSTGSIFSLTGILGGWWMDQSLTPVGITTIPRPLYHYSLIGYAGGTLLLYLLATRLVQPGRRWRLKRREVFSALAALLVFSALVTGSFLITADQYEWAVVPTQPGGGAATEAPVPGMFGPVEVGTPQELEVTLMPQEAGTPTPAVTPSPEG